METWLAVLLRCVSWLAGVGAAVVLIGLFVADILERRTVRGHEDEHGFVQDEEVGDDEKRS
jgi:hypothetical protein